MNNSQYFPSIPPHLTPPPPKIEVFTRKLIPICFHCTALIGGPPPPQLTPWSFATISICSLSLECYPEIHVYLHFYMKPTCTYMYNCTYEYAYHSNHKPSHMLSCATGMHARLLGVETVMSTTDGFDHTLLCWNNTTAGYLFLVTFQRMEQTSIWICTRTTYMYMHMCIYMYSVAPGALV